MTYVVNDSCIRCKTTDCVAVCPVDCFYEGENMLVIHPDECIDCGVCEPECPVDAIKAESEPGLEKWLSLNAEYARIWPKITVKKAPPPDYKDWEGKPDKLQLLLAKSRRGSLTRVMTLIPCRSRKFSPAASARCARQKNLRPKAPGCPQQDIHKGYQRLRV